MDGEKAGEPQIKDRFLVLRYELSRRQSTGAVAGFMRMVTTTMPEWTGFASAISVETKGDAMLMRTESVGYDDYFDQGGGFYPGASMTLDEYQVVDGKLHITVIESETKRIDPDTGETTSVKSDNLPKPSIETAKLPLD